MRFKPPAMIAYLSIDSTGKLDSECSHKFIMKYDSWYLMLNRSMLLIVIYELFFNFLYFSLVQRLFSLIAKLMAC